MSQFVAAAFQSPLHRDRADIPSTVIPRFSQQFGGQKMVLAWCQDWQGQKLSDPAR